MSDTKSWFDRIDRYFTVRQGIEAALPGEKFVSTYDLQTAPAEAAAYYIKKSLAISFDTIFLRDLIHFVPESALTEFAETAVIALENVNYPGELSDFIHDIGLQSPEALHPYLDRLFDLILLHGEYFRYTVRVAWRRATQLDRLFALLKDAEQSDETRASAWICLMETRNPDVMLAAISEAGSIASNRYYRNLKTYLLTLDYDWDETNLRPLIQEAGYHMIFPRDYVSANGYTRRSNHPTYNLHLTEAEKLQFGGVTNNLCWRCKRPLHHVITTTTKLNHLPIHSRQSVEFVTCLSCGMFFHGGAMFYQHDEAGKATSIPSGKLIVNFTGNVIAPNPHPVLFNAIGTGRGKLWRKKRENLLEWKLPGYKVTEVAIVSTPKRWQWQLGEHENVHKLGGYPTWIQDAEYPNCIHCGKKMVLVMQIMDGLPLADGRDQFWGDTGIGYFYWCDDCAISAFITQTC